MNTQSGGWIGHIFPRLLLKKKKKTVYLRLEIGQQDSSVVVYGSCCTVSSKIYQWHCISYLLSSNITIRVGDKNKAQFCFTKHFDWFFCKAAISVGREALLSGAQSPLSISLSLLEALGSWQVVRKGLQLLPGNWSPEQVPIFTGSLQHGSLLL